MNRSLIALSLTLCTGAHAASTVRFRCFEECTLTLAGKKGNQDRPRSWDFSDVAAGTHTLEVTGADGKKASSPVEVADNQEQFFAVDSKGRALQIHAVPLAPALLSAAPSALIATSDGGSVDDTSTLRILCTRPCTIYVGGLRQKNSDPKSAVLTGVKPGSVQIYGKDTLNNTLGGGSIDVPASSEVFVRADGTKTTITAVKPLPR